MHSWLQHANTLYALSRCCCSVRVKDIFLFSGATMVGQETSLFLVLLSQLNYTDSILLGGHFAVTC